MIRLASALWRGSSGSASIELVLVAPLMLVLMFGAVDLGNYFMSQHVVVKAVRDGARYASRRGFAEYSCATASTDVITKTRDITRTGTISGGTARLVGWTDPTSVTLTVRCDTSGTYSGIYKGQASGVPVVKVSATVPYTSLFRHFGIATSPISMTAASEVSVMGV
ncbi:TadE/TadG family type IV pilus assembly protein [Sphingomonas sp. MS122]|uniref:TadE/TadG family type IV pilus assembly protein n=1 Tax=Sphingomonas sp. MS122 TaxID=3412683 RepID=UPI003C2AC232